MKITGLYIDGFGTFHDTRFDDFSGTLTILKGPNEAGKSTVLQFIRRMLYGFPDGRSSENQYTPSAGTIGGRLYLTDDETEATTTVLKRTGKRGNPTLSTPDGTPFGGEAELRQMLGKADAGFYNAICAIGLGELADFRTLKADGIQDRLWSAGTGSLKVPVSSLRKDLQNDLGAIYKKSGKKQILNQKSAELTTVESEIKSLELLQDEYDRFHEQRSGNESTIETFENQFKEAETAFRWYERLQNAWEPFIALQQAEKDIVALPKIASFPEDCLARLENHEIRIDELRADLEIATATCQSCSEELDAIICNEPLLEKEPEIRNLERGVEKYRSDTTSKEILSQKIAQARAAQNQLTGRLGPDWDDARVRAVDISLPAKTFSEKTGTTFEQFTDECKDIEREIAAAEKERDTLREKIASLEEKIRMQGAPRSADILKNNLDDLHSLRAKVPKLKGYNDTIADLEVKEAQTREILGQMPSGNHLPLWPAVIMVMCGVFLLGTGWYLQELLIAAIACFVLILAAGVYVVSAKSTAEKREKSLATATFTEATPEKVTTLKGLKEKAIREYDELKARLETLAASCGFAEVPDTEMIASYEAALRDEEKRAVRESDLQGQADEVVRNLKITETTLEHFRQEKIELDAEQKTVLEQWTLWLSGQGLSKTLMPHHLPEIYTLVRQYLEKEDTIEGYQSELIILQETTAAYEETVQEIADAACFPYDSNRSVDLLVEQLATRLSEERSLRNRETTLAQNKIGYEQDISDWNSRLITEKQRLAALFGEGGVSNADEFRTNAGLFAEHQNLREVTEKAKSSILATAGPRDYDTVIATLKTMSPAQLDEQIAANKIESQDLAQRLGELKEENGNIRAKIEAIEENGDLITLRMKRQEILEEMHRYSRNWATLALAEKMLSMAVETYERERQPLIIREAQSFFSEITGGRYAKILTPLESEGAIRLEEATGLQKNVGDLSTGTAEQLYLALRFGYIRDFGRNGTSLPVIFDDILVNFDPRRQQKACEAIRSLTETNQVFYFTCHPETAAMLEEAVEGAKVVEIG